MATMHDDPVPMNLQERHRMAVAVRRARTAYPGPAGEVLVRELTGWQDFGYRLGGERIVMRLVAHLLSAEATVPAEGPR